MDAAPTTCSATQQQLVALTGQADLEASIVITAPSLVLSVAATEWDESALQPAVTPLLAIGVLASLATAVLAVYPKFSTYRWQTVDRWSADANSLFFGDFSAVPRDVWIARMGEVLRDDATLYRSSLVDLHAQGHYLVRKKYRYLRLSYTLLLAGRTTHRVATHRIFRTLL